MASTWEFPRIAGQLFGVGETDALVCRREGRRYDRLPAFATRTKAIEQTKRIIDAETWQRYCEYNVSRDMEHANTRKEFNEWCVGQG